MGKEKAGFLTPKAISNRIKAKGLQKLRWYCQMCQKQCRDENGFKCHTTSESHQRQLLLFADNQNKFLGNFSREFLQSFILLLSHRYGTKRVLANTVYQEYISDRDHLHMNSTHWNTLGGFVKFLGKNSLCKIDETEKGWHIQWIDRSLDAMKREKQTEKRKKMDVNDEEETAKFIAQQIAYDIDRQALCGEQVNEVEFHEFKREDDSEKISFSMGNSTKHKAEVMPSNPFEGMNKNKRERNSGLENKAGASQKSALQEIMQQEERMREVKNRRDDWLHKGIIVKVKAKELKEFYGKKAVVKELCDTFVGKLKVMDSGQLLKVDQDQLETVIPAIGKLVFFVNGAYRGKLAELISLEESSFSCTVKLHDGLLKGRMLSGVRYEDVSKFDISLINK